MNEAESGELMRRTLGVQVVQSAELSTLTTLLEHLPLALAQAAAYMHENSLSVGKYIQVLKAGNAKIIDLVSQNFEALGRDPEIPNAVAATWMLSFDQIRQKKLRAAQLLSLMAFLDRQNIPELFLLDQDEDPLDNTYLVACGELKAFSLVTETARPGTFDIHRLVQMVTQKWLVSQGECETWAKKSYRNVVRLLP